MNHFLQDMPLPQDDYDIGYYGSTATEYIIKRLMSADSAVRHYCAQIFGGAAVIKTTNPQSDIGGKNTDIAQRILGEHNIRIIREEFGGDRGRRIRFDTATNAVFCRFAGQIRRKKKAVKSRYD